MQSENLKTQLETEVGSEISYPPIHWIKFSIKAILLRILQYFNKYMHIKVPKEIRGHLK